MGREVLGRQPVQPLHCHHPFPTAGGGGQGNPSGQHSAFQLCLLLEGEIGEFYRLSKMKKVAKVHESGFGAQPPGPAQPLPSPLGAPWPRGLAGGPGSPGAAFMNQEIDQNDASGSLGNAVRAPSRRGCCGDTFGSLRGLPWGPMHISCLCPPRTRPASSEAAAPSAAQLRLRELSEGQGCACGSQKSRTETNMPSPPLTVRGGAGPGTCEKTPTEPWGTHSRPQPSAVLKPCRSGSGEAPGSRQYRPRFCSLGSNPWLIVLPHSGLPRGRASCLISTVTREVGPVEEKTKLETPLHLLLVPPHSGPEAHSEGCRVLFAVSV